MKSYIVSKHAAERAANRLGMSISEAQTELPKLMQTAEYQGDTKSSDSGKPARIYDNHNARVRMLIGPNNVIVTVYNMRKPLAFLPDELMAEVSRKAAAFLRKYMRRNRELERAIIEAKIAVLENERKKLRVNNPATKAVIDVKISDIQTQLDAMKAEQRELASKIAEVSAHV